MDHQYKEIAEKIESGEYSAEARDWYLRNYQTRFIERSYLLVMVLLMFVLMGMAKYYYSTILPIVKNWPVKVTISDASEEWGRITYLGNAEKNFDIDNIFIELFGKRVVDALESYDHKNDFAKLRKNLNIIKQLGGTNLNSFYQNQITLRSRDSIILKYRRSVTKTIEFEENSTKITKVKSENSDNVAEYEILIDFWINDIYASGKTERINYTAKLLVQHKKIEYDYEKKDYSDIYFKTLSYERYKK